MEWSSLAWQPAFTATASNVLFYWSHDIGGHRSQVCPGPQAVGPCYKDYGHDEAGNPASPVYTPSILAISPLNYSGNQYSGNKWRILTGYAGRSV
jgi:hypothetical protein